MPLQQTLASIGKMGRKDPLKMVFVLLLVSVLPLLVVGTLTEVLLQSRASYPISGATGGGEARLKYRSSFIESPTCNQTEGNCRNGKEVVVFYNSSSKTLADININKIIVYTVSDKQRIETDAIRAFFTNGSGTERLSKIDKVGPGQEVYVAVESAGSISSVRPQMRAEILFTGKDCATNSDTCTSQWAHSSPDLLFDEFVKTLAPEKMNKIAFENNFITFSLDGFVIKKDNKFYSGTKDGLVTTFDQASQNELVITSKWLEQGDQITLISTIRRSISVRAGEMPWFVDNVSFSNGKGTMNISYDFYPNSDSKAIEYKSLTVGTLNYNSFVTLVRPRLTTTWSGTGQTSEAARFDLNNDSVLDLRDYTLLVNSFGKTGAANFVKADINGDGKVNKADEDQITSQIKLRKLQRYN